MCLLSSLSKEKIVVDSVIVGLKNNCIIYNCILALETTDEVSNVWVKNF